MYAMPGKIEKHMRNHESKSEFRNKTYGTQNEMDIGNYQPEEGTKKTILCLWLW
jgi:hypothetical protein